jgi:hypothetical protein
MVDLVEGVTEGGQVLPDPAETAVRSNIFGQTAVALGETAASAGRSLAGTDTFEVTGGASPLGSSRYDTESGDVELPGSGGGTGTPISRLAGIIINNVEVITGGVVLLVVIYVLGNLFTINVGDSTS